MRSGFSGGIAQENGTILAIVPDVSVVVPVRDEVESLPLLLEKAIASSLAEGQLSYEDYLCVG